MTPLLCPHCGQPVSANPLGRWYARFICPHCRGALQFDPRTNATGIVGALLFFVMAFALVVGDSEAAKLLAAVTGALWIASMGMSYALRRIVKA
jgi:uncharacterized protein YbaR (Trm112 family)